MASKTGRWAPELATVPYSARRGENFIAAADALQEKHGSRKSGMLTTGQGARKNVGKSNRKKPRAAGQLDLDL